MTTKEIYPGIIRGRWTVLSIAPKQAGKRRKWICRCQCGTERPVETSRLISGESKSCGCYKSEKLTIANTKHGHACRKKRGTQSRIYMIWQTMIKRCHSPTDKGYAGYGARGISVCESWRNSFDCFLADMGEPLPGLSIERDDVNGNYEPSNCRWATSVEQSNNARSNLMLDTPDGVMTVSEFSRRHGFHYGTTRSRIRRGATEINGIKFEVLGRRDSIRKQAA